MTEKTRVLVTACGASGGMGVLKSLKEKSDLDLYLADSGPLNSGFAYAPACPHFVVPNGDHPDYAEAVLQISRDQNIEIVFPMADEEVFALAQKKKQFEETGIEVIVSELETVHAGADKARLMKLASELDIPHPETYEASEVSQGMKVELPLVLKPRFGRGGHGVHFVQDGEELERGLANLRTAFQDTAPVIQEMIPGGVGSIHMVGVLCDRQSEIKAMFACRSLRTKFSFGGPAVAGEPVSEQGLIESAVRILRASGKWYGPVSIEFKKDERDGVFKLLEINPRIWGYNYLATRAGIDFPYLAVRIARGENIPIHSEYDKEVVLVRCSEDKVFSKSEWQYETDIPFLANTKR